ncbi:MAG: hypothetical protein LRY51_15565 [Geovibrio sp.]|nr:hypothetical protein [Geovibrio sp.]
MTANTENRGTLSETALERLMERIEEERGVQEIMYGILSFCTSGENHA